MMKTKYIYGIIASALLMAVTASCSDNFNNTLEPVETATTLSAQIDGKDLNKLSFDAGPKDTTINVLSNTRWTVEVSEYGWCSLNTANGRGNQSIRLSVLEDMTEPRNCTLTLYKLDAENKKIEEGKWTIAISQVASDVKLSPSGIEPFGAQPLKGQDFQITANAAWTLSVNYEREDVKFITILPDTGMTDMGDGTYSGTSDAKFSITLQNNGTAAVRRATLELKSNAGSYSVEIIQQKSENPFDVSPNSTRYVEALGGDLDFSILSESGWTITTADESWISFSETSRDVGSASRVDVKAYVAPNSEGRQRRGVIHFTPHESGYVPVEVEVVQNGFDLTFRGDISEGSDRFTEAGGALFYTLDSRFKWEVSAKDWIKATPRSGDRADNSQTIEMDIAVNNTYQSRSDSVMIIPLETTFEGGVSLKPSSVGIYPIKIFVAQDGGHEAAISRPWIGDVYEHEEVEMKYNFYSPSYEVKEAGIRWKKKSESEWKNTASEVPSDPHSSTVTFLLEGLETYTVYIAQGYLVLSNGTTKESEISYEFTTAGRFPNKDDNNPVEN